MLDSLAPDSSLLLFLLVLAVVGDSECHQANNHRPLHYGKYRLCWFLVSGPQLISVQLRLLQLLALVTMVTMVVVVVVVVLLHLLLLLLLLLLVLLFPIIWSGFYLWLV